MRCLTSISDFEELQARLAGERSRQAKTIVIPAGTCGQASGASDLIRVAKRIILARGLTDQVRLRVTGCHGYCEMEPSVLVEPRGTFYPQVEAKDIRAIVEAVVDDRDVEELLYVDPATGERVARQADIPFFARQTRTILGRNERLDPIRIYHAIETGGYASLCRVLRGGDPVAVVAEVKASGLRGRGGAGFPTGVKWELLAAQPVRDGVKYLVCNADEGDPGAYMDRSVLEGNPHSIIEGMLIGAFATGATHGVVYVRAEYPLAIKNLTIALRQARELGLLGEGILGTDFSFDIKLVRGAGAFVCGEETALIRSIEGHTGEPLQRPPFPVQRGIHGRPTSINNVETWANIPVVFELGAGAYAKVGTANSSGTKIFSLVGKVRNTGLVEVPMGTTIREIVWDIGGGPSGDAPLKGVQTGGPSGGCLPTDKFDLPIDYDSLSAAGTIMGSGGMIVLDETTCMVDLAKYYMRFLKGESCGKCFTCRKGTQRMYELLDDLSRGEGTLETIRLLHELALVVKDTTMCGLGQSASNPVLSTLRYFRAEYEQHAIERRCTALVCEGLTGARCQAACPIGTEAWRYVAHLARGEHEEAYRVIREKNPFPSVCARVCDHRCESHCKLTQTGGEPVAIRALKRFITDRVDPSAYVPIRAELPAPRRVAVVGSGPSGLTAAHNLSVRGYDVTVVEAEQEPGGMLLSGVPEYRLPRDVLRREVAAVLDDRITLRTGTALGRDVTIDGLLAEGHDAVYLAVGAHRSRRLGLEGEDALGIFPAMRFLRAFNLRGEQVARGRVGVIGGGNSAIDAARVALRQPGVDTVTIYYRRSREEMPAFATEIEAAIEEGVRLVTLVSPVAVHAVEGTLTGIELVRNAMAELDATGRRRFITQPGTEHAVPLDTLVIAIGEQVASIPVDSSQGVRIRSNSTIEASPITLLTGRPGVFAGGDAITGPNTVVDAIAAGRKAAEMIHRYLERTPLRQAAAPTLPNAYVPPLPSVEQDARAALPTVPMGERCTTFAEVERALTPEDATREAARCLRCDLPFTRRAKDATTGGDPR